jgi:hypothetical protein
MLKLFASLLLCLLMIGCSSKSSHQLTGQARAAISPSEVMVFSEAPQRYSEIAIVTATSGASTTPANKGKTEDVLNWLKAEAAALGANGIVLTSLEEDVEMDRVPTTSGTQSSHNNVTKFYQTAQALAVYVD